MKNIVAIVSILLAMLCLDYSIANDKETTVSTVVDEDLREENFKSGSIIHKGWPLDSNVQNIVNYAYKLWGMDFVTVLECENGWYNLKAKWDYGHAHSLCQANDRYHKDIPANFTTDWVVAVEYCYKKRKRWTKFYGPWRLVKWVKCRDYVKSRFTLLI